MANEFKIKNGYLSEGNSQITGSLSVSGSLNNGTYNIASGIFSHAEGFFTTATGQYSHTEGTNTTATGFGSHAEGQNTTANGTGSHAEGASTQAIGDYSHVEGANTVSSGSYQHVQGLFNISSSVQGAFILGNGSFGARSNLIFAAGSQVQITGSVVATSGFTGSLQGTASYATNALSASYAATASYYGGSVISASYAVTASYATNALSASYAPGGASTPPFPYTGSAKITGSLSVTGSISNIGDQTISGSIYTNGTITFSEQPFISSTYPSGNIYISALNNGILHLNDDGGESDIWMLNGSNKLRIKGDTSITGSLSNGNGNITSGLFSHAEGYFTSTGKNTGYTANNISAGLVMIDSGYGDVTGIFTPSAQIMYGDSTTITPDNIISSSYWDTTNTYIQLLNTSVTSGATIILLQSDTIGNLISSNNGDQYIAGPYAHAEGAASSAIGMYSHAEGDSIAQGDYSHAEGIDTLSIGYASHAEGDSTVAVGGYSHTEGQNNFAYSTYSHVEGIDNYASQLGYGPGTIITSGVFELDPQYGDLTSTFTAGVFVLIDDPQGQINGFPNIFKLEVASSTYTGTPATEITLVDTSIDTSDTKYTVGIDGNFTPIYASIGLGAGQHAGGESTFAIGRGSSTEGAANIALGYYQSVVGMYNEPINDFGAFIIGGGYDSTPRNLLVASPLNQIVTITGSATTYKPLTTQENLSSTFTVSGEIVEAANFDGAVILYDLISLVDSTWFQTDQTAANSERLLGIYIGDNKVLLSGYLTFTDTTGDGPLVDGPVKQGLVVYIQEAAVGLMDTTVPTADYVRTLGHILYANISISGNWTMKFNPSNDWVKI